MPRVSAAACRMASRSSGLMVCMFNTRTPIPSLARVREARTAISTMHPHAITVMSFPVRSWGAWPNRNGTAGSVTAGSSTRPPRRIYTGPSMSSFVDVGRDDHCHVWQAAHQGQVFESVVRTARDAERDATGRRANDHPLVGVG